MDKKKLMLLLGAMVVALGSAVAVRSVMTGHAAPAVQAMIVAPTGPRVLVAQRALPVGTIITPDAVAYQQWPKDMVQDAYFIDGATDKAKLIGTVVRLPVTAGQPLTQGALVAPGDRGFLAAALAPGMRAVTIPVSDMSGVAGFIFPGDHVDMMLTQTVKNTDPAASAAMPLSLTETVLRNLRVLATDQTTETEASPTGQSVVKIAHDVTLEVSPRVAEKIEVAQTLGSLSLALRALADDQGEQDQATAPGTLKLGVAAGPHHGKPEAGLAESATSFSTGGDVSRFARRAIAVGPARTNAVHTAGAPMVHIARGNAMSAEPTGNTTAGVTNSAGTTSLPAGPQPAPRPHGGE